MLTRHRELFASLRSHDVRYVILGGFAVVLHGIPRMTFDLDILIEPSHENARRLLDAFDEAGLGTASLTTAEQLLAEEITVFRDVIRIDVQTRTHGISFSEAWRERVIRVHDGEEVPVISREHLIRSKKASGRPRDLEDARILEATDPDKS